MRQFMASVILVLAAESAVAIGLGAIDLKSHLNEPFNATIPITGASAAMNDGVVISLGSPEQFEKAGLARPFVLAMLRFKVVQTNAGPQRIEVSSTQPIKEPALDFLIEVDSADGRLLQRYAVLLDPADNLHKPQAPAPAIAPSAAPESGDPTPAPDVAAPASAPPPAEPGAAVTAPMETGADHTSYGPTVGTDTLWSVANKVRADDSVTIYQVMVALMQRNPGAFNGRKAPKLQTGVILAVPSREESAAVPAAAARADIRQQFDR